MIRSLQAPQDEKARLVHNLMTERWLAAQVEGQGALRPQSPASNVEQDSHRPAFVASSPLSNMTLPTSPSSIASLPTAMATAMLAPFPDPNNPFNVHPEDLQPNYRPLPDSQEVQEVALEGSHTEEELAALMEPVLGCKHYKRNVKIQCFDCKEWHACRHCHDAVNAQTHLLNRRKTENMLCMLCWTPQPAGQYCRDCGQHAAWYYCDICKLWDDDASKRIYHCEDCGICRRGEGLGKDFVHCKVC